MHEHHVMHRDLKPSNIFLCEDGTLKIADVQIYLCYDKII